MMKTILIADDHPLFLDGLATLLKSMIPSSVIYQVGDIYQVQEHLKKVTVDLVLLDRIMPGMDGMKGLAELHKKYPNLPVAIISASDSERCIQEAFDNGAVGFIPKTHSPDKSVAVIKHILLGNIYIPHQIWLLNKGGGDKNMAISPRQMEVLECISQGQSNKIISTKLGITEGTVKQHVNNIYRALSVTNRVLAIQSARDLGLLP